MAVGVGGHHLGAEVGTVESVRYAIRSLSSVDVVQAAARLSITLEQSDRGSAVDSQRALAREIFPEEIAAAVEADLEAGHQGGKYDALFFPGQLMAMERLALAMGADGPGTSFENGDKVMAFVLAAAQVNDVRDALAAPDPDSWDVLDMAMYAMRAAEINKTVSPVMAGGRAYRLWLTPTTAWPKDLESADDYCSRTFSVTVREFAAIALAPALLLLDQKISDHTGLFNPETYFSETTVDSEKALLVLEALTFVCERGDVSGDQETYWCFYDFADRPFLPCGDGLLIPASLRYAVERATTGLFWMLHAASKGDAGELTSHFGRMFESYCVEATSRLASDQLAVSGDVEYGPRRARKKSSDVLICINTGDRVARVFVECRAGRPPRAVFETGDRAAFTAYVDDLKRKLRQLHRSIADHSAGAFAIEGDPISGPAPYLPLLVVDEPFQWSLPLRVILDEFIAKEKLFSAKNVAPPSVCSITEFEYLVSAAERSLLPIEIALGTLVASGREVSISSLVFELTGPLFASSYAQDGWTEFAEVARQVLFGGPSN